MTRPFEGIRIIDITHVLAGPFAAYQLAVLGADVIKVEHPDEPDQSRAERDRQNHDIGQPMHLHDATQNRARIAPGFDGITRLLAAARAKSLLYCPACAPTSNTTEAGGTSRMIVAASAR